MNSNMRRAQIVGTGLIGGSVAIALKNAGWHVTGKDIDESRAERARELNVIDDVGMDSDADLTIGAVPASALEAEVTNALEQTKGIVTDTGSVKTAVSHNIRNPRFIPADLRMDLCRRLKI